jgi:hypothetical protein
MNRGIPLIRKCSDAGLPGCFEATPPERRSQYLKFHLEAYVQEASLINDLGLLQEPNLQNNRDAVCFSDIAHIL